MKIETDQRQTHGASYANCEQNIVNNWNDLAILRLLIT